LAGRGRLVEVLPSPCDEAALRASRRTGASTKAIGKPQVVSALENDPEVGMACALYSQGGT
jgi:hypothetical protein